MAYAKVIIKKDTGKMLFQLRDKKSSISHPGLWSLFGGKIEEGETPKEAAIRELREELGIKVSANNLKLLLSWPPLKKKEFIFQMTLDESVPLKLEEGQSMSYFSRKEILKKKNVVPKLKWLMRVYPLL